MLNMLKKGLTTEEFEKVEGLLGKDFDYVPRMRLNEVIAERDRERTTAKDLKIKAEKYDTVAGELTTLKAKYDTDLAAKDLEHKSYVKDTTISTKLLENKVKNAKAATALIDSEKIGDDFKGLDDEIKRVMTEAPYLFGDDVPGGTGAGGAGGAGAAGGAGDGGQIGADAMRAAVMGGNY